MPQNITPASELIHESWQNYRQHWLTYIEFGVWYLVLAVATWGVDVAVRTWADSRLQVAGFTLLAYIPIILLGLYISMVFIRVIWAHLSDVEPNYSQSLSDSKKRFWSLVGATLVVLAVIFSGTLLLIVPGIILYVRYRFFTYSIVIDGKKAMESLSESACLSKGKFWSVLWRATVITSFFLLAGSLLTSILYALVGTALGDTGKYFGELNPMFTLNGGDLLVTSLLPQLSLLVIFPLLMGADLALWDDLKKRSKQS